MTSLKRGYSQQAIGTRVFGAPFLALLLLGTLAFFTSSQAEAQQVRTAGLQCAHHDQMVKRLGAKFTEVPVSLGLAASGHVLQVFTTKDGETWTLVATAPEGKSCIMAAGKYWQQLPIEPDGPEA